MAYTREYLILCTRSFYFLLLRGCPLLNKNKKFSYVPFIQAERAEASDWLQHNVTSSAESIGSGCGN